MPTRSGASEHDDSGPDLGLEPTQGGVLAWGAATIAWTPTSVALIAADHVTGRAALVLVLAGMLLLALTAQAWYAWRIRLYTWRLSRALSAGHTNTMRALLALLEESAAQQRANGNGHTSGLTPEDVAVALHSLTDGNGVASISRRGAGR